MPVVLLALTSWVQMVLLFVRHESRKEGIYLVPARVFIGIVWLLAFASKAVDPGWHNGTSLSGFLEYQLHASMVSFPTYQALITDVFLPHAALLGWIIVLGELLAGVAILSGSLTNAALLGGIFMNLNFLLAGVPDPSALFIVIQMVMLLAGTGAVFGIDVWLDQSNRSLFRVLRAGRPRSQPPMSPSQSLALVALALGVAVYAALHVKDWNPGGGAHDPAATLVVLALMMALCVTIVALRGVGAIRGGEAESHGDAVVASSTS